MSSFAAETTHAPGWNGYTAPSATRYFCIDCNEFFQSRRLFETHDHPTPIYCTLCDKYFKTKRARNKHYQRSMNHPYCVPCNRRFATGRALHYHIAACAMVKKVPGHYYCRPCCVAPRTAAGLRYHFEHDHALGPSLPTTHCGDIDELKDSLQIKGENVEVCVWLDNMGAKAFPNMIDDFVPEDQLFEDFNMIKSDQDIADDGSDSGSSDSSEFSDDSENCSCEGCCRNSDDLECPSVLSDTSTNTSQLAEDIDASCSSFTIVERIAKLNIHGLQDRAKSQPILSTRELRLPPKNAVRSEGMAQFTCPVCLCDDATEVSVTRCGHMFCKSCIHQAFKNQKICPSCRSPGLKRQLRKVIYA